MEKYRTKKLPKIIQLPSGSFQARIYAGKDTRGKSVYKSITRPTYAEVQMELATFKVEHREEKAQNASNRTVRNMVDDYINRRANVLSPSTVHNYRGSARNNLQELMDIKLSNLSQILIQTAVNKEASRVSPKTLRNAYGLFSAALADEMPGVVFHVRLPPKEKSQIKIPTEEEVGKILATVEGTDMKIPVLLGACCGMRRSEIAALTWDDIDLKAGIIYISKAIVIGDDHEYHEKGTKTSAGTRTIKLFPAVVDALREAKKQGWGKNGRITPNPADITSRWRWVIRHSGVPSYRFHDLRHYLISVMLSLNIPKKYIADYVGHETENMIDQVYGHIMASKKESVQDELQAYFSDIFLRKMN